MRKSSGVLAGFALLLVTAAVSPASAETPAGMAFANSRLTQAASPEAFAAVARASPLIDFVAPADNVSLASSSVEALPEAPTPNFASYQASSVGSAPHYALNIPSGWTAQSLSAGDKFVLGFRAIASPIGLAGTVIGAGYSHLTNGQPNYGTDGDAFAQRVGAGVLRSASQNVFSISVLSPVLHQDPRYYVLGSGHSFVKRVLYAATRPIIGRTDGGHSTVNAALLIGYAGAAALTPTYYPTINQNFRDCASTFGSSIGGAAIGFAVSEFSDQIFKAIHLKH